MSENALVIERVFNARLEQVWKAWTEPEMIKKWWGPKNFTAPFISIDFQVGGEYLYCMRGAVTPGGEEHDFWSGGTFDEIVPMKKIVVTDHFSNGEGDKLSPKDYGMVENFPEEMTVTTLFEKVAGGKTKVTIIYPKPDSPEELEAMLKSGMQDGWNSSLDKLTDNLKANIF